MAPPTGRRGGKARGRGGGGGRGQPSAGDDTRGAGAAAGASGPAASSNKPKRKNVRGSSTRPATHHAVLRKVVVRQIPHDVDEESVSELLRSAYAVPRESIWRFVPGKVHSNNRAPSTGRMYLDFKKDVEAARKLITALNGFKFETTKETQLTLEVEFAPYQKIPREKARKDSKNNTIDRDPEFVAFLEELAKPKEKLPSAEAVADSADPEPVAKPIAALVQYLNEKKAHSREKGKGKSGKSYDKSSSRRQAKKKEKSGKAKSSKDRSKGAATDANGESTKQRKTRSRNPVKKNEPAAPVQPGMLRIMAPKQSAAPTSSENGGSTPATANESQAPSSKKASGAGANNRSRGRGRGGERKEGKPAKQGDQDNTAGPSEGKSRPRREPRSAKNDGEGRKKKVFAPKESSVQKSEG